MSLVVAIAATGMQPPLSALPTSTKSGSSPHSSSANHLPVRPEAGLDLVEHEHRAVAPAQLLGGPQVAGRRERHRAALDRLDHEGGHVAPAQLRLELLEVAERDQLAARQQRAEALLEELVADERQRPEGDSVKAALAGDEPRRPVAARANFIAASTASAPVLAKNSASRPLRQARRERLREHSGKHRVVDLDAVEEVLGERRLQHRAHVGVVVAQARESLPRVEVEVAPPAASYR